MFSTATASYKTRQAELTKAAGVGDDGRFGQR